MEDELKVLKSLQEQCAGVSSDNEREEIFKKTGADIKSLLHIIYDKEKKFKLKSKAVEKYEASISKVDMVVFPLGQRMAKWGLEDFLAQLASGDLSGNNAKKACVGYLRMYPEYRKQFLCALDKDLECHVGAKTLNRVFPDLFVEFHLALSEKFNESFFQKTKGKGLWHVSRKMDGVRFLIMVKKGKVEFKSRSGKTFPKHIKGLDYFDRVFSDPTIPDGVFDGEMCLTDEEENDHFSATSSILRPNATKNSKSKKVEIDESWFLCFFCFDYIPWQTFMKGAGGPIWSERQKLMKQYLPQREKKIVWLEQFHEDMLEKKTEEFLDMGCEGTIIRFDTKYTGKRSKFMMKIKHSEDAEYKIEDIEYDYISPGKGKEKIHTINRLAIRHKGKLLHVGSGLTMEMRKYYQQYPERCCVAKIKHNGETKNSKDGQYSLRHPVVLEIYGPQGRPN